MVSLFTEICISIIGIVGIFCSSEPQVYPPSNDCYKFDTQTLVCNVEDMTEINVRTSYYNPALCKDGEENINCYYDENGNSTGDYLGDGTPTQDAYGWAMACPIGMYDYVIDIKYAGEWHCRDSGGKIHPDFGKVHNPENDSYFSYEWYITVDVLLEKAEWWNYMSLPFEIVKAPKGNTISKN